jgi:hypothetical protein
MSMTSTNQALTDWLQGRGYTEEEIEKILARLADYDHKTLSDALFDSVGNDSQTLDEIIRGVLRDE